MIKFGGVKFFIKGVNQERAFTALSRISKIYALKRTSATTAEFCVEMKAEKLFTRKVEELCLTIEAKKRFGLVNELSLFLKRFGILAGIFVSLLLYVTLSFFVFRVELIGNEKITYQQIEDVLAKNHFNSFVLKGKVNTKDIEKYIMTEFDNISLVSVIMKGNSLIISIKEKVINDEYENTDKFLPLTSKYDGLITGIKLVSGTLKVKVGQVVQSGDVLVEPYMMDSSGEKRPIKAEAQIDARVWYIGKQTHFSKRLETVRTGKMQRFVNLTFLGLNLTSNLKKEPAFASYETVVNTTCISLFNILPIYREEILYYELEKHEIEESFESVKENILEKAKEMALNLVEEYDIIKKEFFNIANQNEITYVDYVIEVEKRIDIL